MQPSPELTHLDSKGGEVGRYLVGEKTLILGRDGPQGSLDADDRTLSRRHFTALSRDGRLFGKDLKSANGTFLRVVRPLRLKHGDSFRIGQQHLTLSATEDAVLDTGHGQPIPTVPSFAPLNTRIEKA